MKRAGSAVLGLALAALGSSACGVYTYPSGLIYSGTQTPHGMMRVEGAGAGKSGTKIGKSCATGILGMIAFGDASLAAAEQSGGISDVQSVEFGGTNVLGVYSRGCTIVYGN